MVEQRYPNISVVVINARETNLLKECLQALVHTNYPNPEIIVVDCQTPQIEKWVEKQFPKVKVIHFNEDIGSSASHNVGAAKANPKSKYLAFLDNDAVVELDWLKESVKLMENDEKIGVVQPKILKIGAKERLDHTGLALDALGTWSTSFDMDEKDFNEVFDIFAAASATCIVRRRVFDLLGGFDEDYFIYDDDTDFCWRMILIGHRIIFAPAARTHHRGNVTKGLTPKRLYHSAKNRICTMLKNYELKNLWLRICPFYILSLLTVFSFMLLLKFELALAVIKGLNYPISNYNRIWRKRLMVQNSRKVSDNELLQRKILRNDIYPTLLDVRRKAATILFKDRNQNMNP